MTWPSSATFFFYRKTGSDENWNLHQALRKAESTTFDN